METLRNAVPRDEPTPPAKNEERISIFWRVFGGTLVSIAALVVLTLCQYFNNCINELRGDLGHLHDEVHKEIGHLATDLRKDMAHLLENHANLVNKEEYTARVKSIWDSIKELQTLSATVAGLKERCSLHDQQLHNEDERKEMVRELQKLRERLANLEGRQAAAPSAKPTPPGEE
jgi:hypothetical protein